MEVYIPYIVGSSVSALIGKYAYNYIYSEETVEDNTEDETEFPAIVAHGSPIDKGVAEKVTKNAIKKGIDYSLLDSKLNESAVSSVSNNEKIAKLTHILKNECNRTIHSNLKKNNVRRKWIVILNEYESIGHSAFVQKWTRQ